MVVDTSKFLHCIVGKCSDLSVECTASILIVTELVQLKWVLE